MGNARLLVRQGTQSQKYVLYNGAQPVKLSESRGKSTEITWIPDSERCQRQVQRR